MNKRCMKMYKLHCSGECCNPPPPPAPMPEHIRMEQAAHDLCAKEREENIRRLTHRFGR